MKLLLALTVAVAVIAAAKPDDSYERWESFNADELVENTRLLKSFANCFLGNGKCTPEAANFKKVLPEAVQSSCGKCSEKLKVLVGKVMKAMQTKLPREWETLRLLHDPEDTRLWDLQQYMDKYAP